jgi:hypothetical protein
VDYPRQACVDDKAAGGLIPFWVPGFRNRIFRDDGSAVAGRSSGFFVGTMKEFLATEWPAEHGEPVGVRE